MSIICPNWLYISTRYGFSCHAKQFHDIIILMMWNRRRKEELSKTSFCSWINLVKWIQESIQQLFCKKFKKLMSVSHFKIFRPYMKYKSQPLGLKQQSYFEYKATTCCSIFTVSILDWAISLYIGWYTYCQDASTPIFIVHKEGLYIAFIIFFGMKQLYGVPILLSQF